MKSVKYRAYNVKLKKMSPVALIDFLNQHIAVVSTNDEKGSIIHVWPATETLLLMQLPNAITEKKQPIYEGDVVKCLIRNQWGSFIEEYAVIIFAGNSFIMQGEQKPLWGDAQPEDIIAKEVIGNALEQPELLEKYRLVFTS